MCRSILGSAAPIRTLLGDLSRPRRTPLVRETTSRATDHRRSAARRLNITHYLSKVRLKEHGLEVLTTPEGLYAYRMTD